MHGIHCDPVKTQKYFFSIFAIIISQTYYCNLQVCDHFAFANTILETWDHVKRTETVFSQKLFYHPCILVSKISLLPLY